MAGIPEEIIERVRDAHDIVELVARTVTLKKQGASYKACCPFHEEKTPSFHVNPARQIYKCFGCGKGGNVFHWLMEIRSLTFPEAVRQLADERNIEIPTTVRGGWGVRRDVRQRVARVLGFAERWFHHMLKEDAGEEARRYLERRGYDTEAQAAYSLGYAPASWDGFLAAANQRGVSAADVAEAGLAKAREGRSGHYDTFRNRVMFPIRDWQGRLVTFAGRALDADDPAKYINGPETPVFQKSRVLYALDLARPAIVKSEEALLMEGYTDVLACHRNGIETAVAGMGTALTPEQAGLLARFAKTVVLLYDGDDAGERATERALDVLLVKGLHVRVAQLPRGLDVDDILQEEGPEALRERVGEAPDWFAYLLAQEGRRRDLSSARGRSEAAEAIAQTIAKVKGDVERNLRLRELAERLGGDLADTSAEAAIRAAASQAWRKDPSRRAARRGASSREGAAQQAGAAGTRPGGAGSLDRGLVQAGYLAGALADARLRHAIFRAVGPEEFTDPVLARLYNALFALYEQGGVCDREALAARFPDDPEAIGALAALPEDPALVERVQSQIAFLERRRLERERQEAVRAQLQTAPSSARHPDQEDRNA